MRSGSMSGAVSGSARAMSSACVSCLARPVTCTGMKRAPMSSTLSPGCVKARTTKPLRASSDASSCREKREPALSWESRMRGCFPSTGGLPRAAGEAPVSVIDLKGRGTAGVPDGEVQPHVFGWIPDAEGFKARLKRRCIRRAGQYEEREQEKEKTARHDGSGIC